MSRDWTDVTITSHELSQLHHEISYLTAENKRLEDIIFELEENLKCAKDQNHYYVLMCKFRDENEKLKRELHQQRFNNKHNLSIDQKVADEIAKLKRIVEVYEKANGFYACGDSVIEDDIGKVPWEFEGIVYHIDKHGRTARQAKEEVERIRGEGK